MTPSASEPSLSNRITDDEMRWQAVARRDKRADGVFVYSVRTTGVYCRPTCPARLALRKNVRFHETAVAAERAGYRPCKRCRPSSASLIDQHRAAVSKACRIIERASDAPSLGVLAAAVGMSASQFHRVFESLIGLTPKAYAVARRSERVRREVAGGKTVSDAIYNAGFNSNGRFYATSAQVLGMTPKRFQRGGQGVSMRFAVGQCSLGSILVAASEVGICSIALGDDPQSLVRGLQDQFPRAELVGGDREFEKWVATVVGFVERPLAGLALPLDVQGTAFQQRVWQLLRKIPCGATTTYADIAKRLGKPNAVRAVAGACSANKIAVAIPCHRVIRTDGSLSGYRWGVERKAALLARERPRGVTMDFAPALVVG